MEIGVVSRVTIGCYGGGGGDTDTGALGATKISEEEMPFCDVGWEGLDTGGLGDGKEAWADEDDPETGGVRDHRRWI